MREIESMEDLEAFLADTARTPLFLLKHSTRCPTSSHALAQYRTFLGTTEEEGHAYLDLITFRSISNHIESMTGIRHQSPQAILFEKGEAKWSETHYAIDPESLQKALVESSENREVTADETEPRE